MLTLLVLFSTFLACLALPQATTTNTSTADASPTVTIASPQATIVGVSGTTEEFLGIPFAQPPVNSLRLKPPQPLTEPQGTINATQNGKACPQFYFSDAINDAIPTAEIGLLLDTPLFQQATDSGEDCLVLNVYRPQGTTADSKLPILFWIFGGGFELGYNSMYDGSVWVENSVDLGQPIIMVTVNYRVGGFGFLGGKELLADNSTNLGLLDQRLGLQWVADNIADFGGDPTKVTIWGESAGSISVFDHLIAYDGDNTYKGQPLFRGAMMNSGSVIPADPLDCPKAQSVYDTVVAAAGCSSASDTLSCLRTTDYETFLNATNSVSGLVSYTSVALSYLPRPGDSFMTASPDVLGLAGTFAKVPFIIGDQEDEGTLFALFQSNTTTTDEIVDYLLTVFFHDANRTQIEQLYSLYSDISTYGSPFRTGTFNEWYPQFKQLAALLGDLVFTISRRATLNIAQQFASDVPTWSYLSSYDYGTPILGTFHGSDILQVFFGILPNYASSAFHAYYVSFVNSLDPNNVGDTNTTIANWPTWATDKQLLNMTPQTSTLITDDFRSDVYDFLLANLKSLYI